MRNTEFAVMVSTEQATVLYYNYATNKSKVLTYDIDGRNNIGFRLGVSF